MGLRVIVSSVALAASVAFAQQAVAQDALVDTTAIAAACSVSAVECQLAVQAAIAALTAAGLAPSALNSALGVIAGTAVSAAASMPPAERRGLAAVMSQIAAVSTDETQRTALTKLARDLQSGADVDLIAQASAIVGGAGGGGGGGGAISSN